MSTSNDRTIHVFTSPSSDVSARLRIALNLKNLPFSRVTVDLAHGHNHDEKYARLNPAKTVPTLVIGDNEDTERAIVLTQSLAALEYLEEAYPDAPPLLPPPDAPVARAKVRTLLSLIGTDLHPLTTHRVGRAIPRIFPSTEEQVGEYSTDWSVYWITRGLQVYETALQYTAGRYSYGDEVTLADVYLAPQCWTAERMGVDLSRFPKTREVFGRLGEIKAFADEKHAQSSTEGADKE